MASITFTTKPKIIPENVQVITEGVLEKWLNKIYCIDCIEGMKKLPDKTIDLVITSPPYDEIRDYNGFKYNLHATRQRALSSFKRRRNCCYDYSGPNKKFWKNSYF